ncbi:hypothetical protein E5329_19275 [Petralouisia muris]|uniref:Uncharacterized protein n=1 Tax=Petralouisia muris TaxID=3032872 RepID=A0AC61RS31_9FIRM|nr:hypothetical protein [Petralouisia muris]TGY92598.1 hypothetical protein E5329_19275 [Petralouisia muris]
MKYRGLTFDRKKQAYKWVYGMPSYGFETEEIAEIGTPNGDFYDIDPTTLGEETEYTDKHGKRMYTGDIVTLLVDGEVREFVVDRATVDREYNTLPGFEGETVKVRLAGVVVFRWIDPDGIIHQLLPCVDPMGIDDTLLMEIIGAVAERAVHESESQKQ